LQAANKAMKNHKIWSVERHSKWSCRLIRFIEPNCVSINLGSLQKGKHKCELNNATKKNQYTKFGNKPAAFTYPALEEIPARIAIEKL